MERNLMDSKTRDSRLSGQLEAGRKLQLADKAELGPKSMILTSVAACSLLVEVVGPQKSVELEGIPTLEELVVPMVVDKFAVAGPQKPVEQKGSPMLEELVVLMAADTFAAVGSRSPEEMLEAAVEDRLGSKAPPRLE